MTELNKLGLWSEDIKNNIILNKGSIQQIDCIPAKIREKYKIVERERKKVRVKRRVKGDS